MCTCVHTYTRMYTCVCVCIMRRHSFDNESGFYWCLCTRNYSLLTICYVHLLSAVFDHSTAAELTICPVHVYGTLHTSFLLCHFPSIFNTLRHMDMHVHMDMCVRTRDCVGCNARVPSVAARWLGTQCLWRFCV